ncbi:hypothetical protein GF345_06385 [Candidatus Woesearchaeota archaeon]|nr:hypothetical protein [Candidatus Woesearchaeota archaeon]
MLYLPEDQYLEKRQYNYFHIEKPLEDKPDMEKYGTQIGYDGLQKILSDSIRPKDKDYSINHDTDYKRTWPETEVLPFLDAFVKTELPPGLRGYCFPALRQVFIRHGDTDPYMVIRHENKHVQIYGQDPNHSEWEIRRLDEIRKGRENEN